MTSTTIMHVHL